MYWFSRHTNWLCKETTELSRNSIYGEDYQFIDKTLISTGCIKVHKTKTEYYPILIIYPEATPYIPPNIYILNTVLDEDTSRKYSTLPPEEIRKCIQSNVKFFNRRHQNGDGSICFIETGDLHSDLTEFYPIKKIINRLRVWLSGKIPKDSREVELFYHFKNRANDIKYLVPDLFFNAEIVKGKYFAGLISIIYANLLNGVGEKTYMGVTILGENERGVSLPPKVYKKEQLTLFTPMPDLKILLTPEKDKEKNKAIEDGKLIEGYWWDISKEPEPFSDINMLAKYIGNGHENKGFKKLIEFLKKPLSKPDNIIHIGIRFPGRRGGKDWQMFRLKRGTRPLVFEQDEKEFIERLSDYSIEVVQQEYFTENYFYMRNKGRADWNILKSKNVSIIGCGALGSEVADSLNKAGIGKILLVDKDIIEAHNVIRHILGINEVSLPKVYGMSKHLILHNPFTDADIRYLDILTSELKDYIPIGAIGISTIADDNIEAFLNEQAVNEERIVFYCRALRGGKAARIFRVIPQQDACKTCLSIYSKEKESPFINIEEDEELPVITNECNNPIRPASAADLKTIAGVFSRIIIDFLHGVNIDINHWIWSTESLEKLKLSSKSKGSINIANLQPHPSCPICQKLTGKKVYINEEAYEFMKQESTNSQGIETGGVLIGYKTEDGKYIILRTTGPGPKALKEKIRFEKDLKYCQKELEKSLKELGDKGLYLGEWHFHPVGSNEPSGLDIKSLTEVAYQDNYHIDKPIMIILAPSLEYAITIHDKNGQCVKLPIKVFNPREDKKLV